MAELGYVGLGVMGSSVTRRLLDAGHDVTVWNRTREKAEPLLQAGAQWADSPREVAERSAPGHSGQGCAPSGRSIVMQR